MGLTLAKRAFVAVVLTGLAAPNSADARRDATAKETQSVAAALDRDPACSNVHVSTVDRRYASWKRLATDACDADGPNTAALKRAGRSWKVLGRSLGSFGICVDSLRRVPERVGRDLKLCGRPGPVLVVTYYQSQRLESRPENVNAGQDGNYVDLAWQRWSQREGVGRGMLWYRRPNAPASESFRRAPINLRFSRRIKCKGFRTFSRMRATAIRSEDRKRIRHVTTTRRITCNQATDELFGRRD